MIPYIKGSRSIFFLGVGIAILIWRGS